MEFFNVKPIEYCPFTYVKVRVHEKEIRYIIHSFKKIISISGSKKTNFKMSGKIELSFSRKQYTCKTHYLP